MKKVILLTLFSLNLFSNVVFSGELSGASYWNGLKTSFTYLYQGSYKQFQAKNNLYYASAAAPALWFSFSEDKRISANARTKSIPKIMQWTSDLAPVMGLPIISFVAYSYGVKNDNPKLTQFATEYFATMYLAFIESAALSVIDIHERPSSEKLSAVETNLRGKSSFPSGHVMPYAALALKTFQFYGPYAAIAPTGLLILTSIQRVRDGKHYLSDVVGGFFITAFASEGVRAAGNYSENHPAYKAIFERNVALGIIEHDGVVGPKISFNWN